MNKQVHQVLGIIKQVSLNGAFGEVELDNPVEDTTHATISIETKGRFALMEVLGGTLVLGTKVRASGVLLDDTVSLLHIELSED